MNLKQVTINGETFNATVAQISALDVLTSSNGGGFATAHDYVSESGRIKPETADITFISRFSYSRLNARKKAALESLTLDDIRDSIKEPKLAALSDADLLKAFEDRKAYLIESIDKTASGDRSDAHRQGHDRCYLRIADGVRVHYKTFKDADGIKQPVMLGGFPIAESIMLDIIEVSRKVKVPGEYKVVNSGVPVLIGNVIEHALPKSTKFRALSLKEDNFTSLTIASQVMLPEDFKGVF